MKVMQTASIIAEISIVFFMLGFLSFDISYY